MIDFWRIGFDLAERMNLIPQLQNIGYLIDRLKVVNHCARATSGFQAEILRRALPNHFFSLLRGDLAEVILIFSQTRSRSSSATASLPFVEIESASMFNSKTAAHDDSM